VIGARPGGARSHSRGQKAWGNHERGEKASQFYINNVRKKEFKGNTEIGDTTEVEGRGRQRGKTIIETHP